jgi:hypothetical protein
MCLVGKGDVAGFTMGARAAAPPPPGALVAPPPPSQSHPRCFRHTGSGASDSILAAQEEFSQEFRTLEEVLERERLLYLYELPEGATLVGETEALRGRIDAADAARAALHEWAVAMGVPKAPGS